MKYARLIWLALTTEHAFPGERWRIDRLLLVLLALSVLMTAVAVAGPQAVQLCPISANTFAVPTQPTDSLRTLNPQNIQNCIAFSALTPDLKLYGGNPHAWRPQADLGITLPSPSPPVTTPPVGCPVTYSATQWTCTYTAGMATCTSPLVKDATP